MPASPIAHVTSPILVALDFDDINQALMLVDQIDPQCCRLKIGKEMFTRFGPNLVRDLHSRGFDIFLDLKFHDIPNTVAKAVSVAADLGVWMVNVHAAGGLRMMEAARKALVSYGEQAPYLIAVTLLTSMDEIDLKELGIVQSSSDYTLNLAKLAKRAGLDGVVCSAQEAILLKKELGLSFKLITPGIRPAGSELGDQRRIMTPKQAQDAGVDYMVIGRPITQAADPAASLQSILQVLETR